MIFMCVSLGAMLNGCWVLIHSSSYSLQITPSRQLVYHPCFEAFQCARLDLPMDWNKTDMADDDRRVQLAVARLPAKVPVTDERYGGVLWLQSGGPRESGIDYILNFGKGVQLIVGSELDPSDTIPDDGSASLKYFDILAIDSRGLNNSTPCFSCFPTLSSRENWLSRSAAEGVPGSSNVSLQDLWAMAQVTGRGCSQRSDGQRRRQRSARSACQYDPANRRHGRHPGAARTVARTRSAAVDQG